MNTNTKRRSRPACFFALLVGITFAGMSSVTATFFGMGGLVATPSGNNLNLSFATTSLNFYTVQTSSDLQRWTSIPLGVPGDGTVKTVTVTNAIAGGSGFYRLVIQTPTRLLLPQSTAFAILGYWCGGIQETVSAGFNVANGLPTGVVDLSTTCSGSGRDGGHSTTHRASAVVTWDLAGNVVSATPLTNGVTVPPTTGNDGLGDFIYNAGAVAYLVVPVPGAPTGVTAVQSGDVFQVSWTPNAANPADVISSTLTATPVNSTNPILSTIVTGSVNTGIIPTLEPQTTYQVTVVNQTIGGSSRPSTPISVTTSPATIPPSDPTNVLASWSILDPTGSTDTIIVSWPAADPGNSPVDQYLITVTGSDGAGTFTQTVSGTTLTAYFNVDFVPNWSVTVQAHNGAGSGPVSAAVTLGGL